MSSKRFNSTPTRRGENWTEQTRPSTPKSGKYHSSKTQNNNITPTSTGGKYSASKQEQRGGSMTVDMNNNSNCMADAMVATKPPTGVATKSLVRNLKTSEQLQHLSVDESSSVSTNESESDEAHNSSEDTIHSSHSGHAAQPVSYSSSELTCNTYGGEYEQYPVMAQMVPQHQASSSYYVYQPSPSPHQSPYGQTANPAGYYYHSYSPYPVYDPNGQSANGPATYQTTPAILSSPCASQSTAAMLASYHTPQQQPAQQLYASSDASASGTSTTTPNSGNSSAAASSSTSTTSMMMPEGCNSPPHSQSVSSFTASAAPAVSYYGQQQSGQYMLYSQTPTQSSYLSPQQMFQSPVPTSTTPYMYQQHVMNAPVLMSPCQSTPSGMHQVPMYANSTDVSQFTPQLYNSNSGKYPSGQNCNQRAGGRYNNRTKRHFVPGQQQQQRYSSFNTSGATMEPQQQLEFTPHSLNFGQAMYTPASSHMSGAQAACCASGECSADQGMACNATIPLLDHNNMYSPPSLCSPYEYTSSSMVGSACSYDASAANCGSSPALLDYACSPMMASPSTAASASAALLPPMQFPLAMAYNMAAEYDTYDENGNLVVEDYSRHQRIFDSENVDEWDEHYDGENEQLACYVCRGRRMCFCYFLKVRYYKFPSFLDLVDHQYKKWKASVVKARKAAAAAAAASPSATSVGAPAPCGAQ